ncbi:hypothetical protein [Siminovitchia terrae]|uniref:hypothetical protein n=1 Tax=Siminovitchia terrae TaxID=1914933 RepID=UPI0028A76FD8|nr:hypothetical protein [Siminovitchia terrae]
MKRKVVFLQNNMLDANEREIFQADIPYEVDLQGNIENEDGLKIPLNDIWVDFCLEYIQVTA